MLSVSLSRWSYSRVSETIKIFLASIQRLYPSALEVRPIFILLAGAHHTFLCPLFKSAHVICMGQRFRLLVGRKTCGRCLYRGGVWKACWMHRSDHSFEGIQGPDCRWEYILHYCFRPSEQWYVVFMSIIYVCVIVLTLVHQSVFTILLHFRASC